MKKTYLLLLSSLFLLSACASQWQKKYDSTGEKQYTLKFQNNNTAPDTGLITISPAALKDGDILFSADKGFVSKSIRYLGGTSVSHTFIYIGDGQVAEAVGSGVRISSIEKSIKESPLLAVYRHPELTPLHSSKIRQFAHDNAGKNYNNFGIVKQLPYTITRKACELPIIPRHIRHLCLNTMAVVQISVPTFHHTNNRYFCSQFVIEAYNKANLPLTHLNPEWISPADILHMRENDVPSIVPNIKLEYVGHLRCRDSLLHGSCKQDSQAINSDFKPNHLGSLKTTYF